MANQVNGADDGAAAQAGMSLRDYVALRLLVAHVSQGGLSSYKETAQERSEWAFQYADAFLRASASPVRS